MLPLDTSALDRTIDTLATRLLAERTPAGHWNGRLASSALATAVATIALVVAGRSGGPDQSPLVRGGVGWLVAHQHEDGGWGDTRHSVSNVSTTALCWAALTAGADAHEGTPAACARAEQWLRADVGDLAPGPLRRTLLARYGSDLTFSVPILTGLAIAGRLGEGETAWRQVPQLPFELAMLPHSWFRVVRLPVVSYALPALVAMGQVRHHRAPSRNPLLAWLRSALRGPTLGVARGMQPYSGGFLEATPLTAFVVMSLVEAGSLDHPVVTHGIRFLCASARPDGSWPIDTNLATWVTTLSIAALEGTRTLAPPDRERVLQWLIAQQSGGVHPFTRADPGGWAWTDLSGGVPDADDTAGALLALRRLGGAEATGAALGGIQWLLDLQNGDGGVPTFCRGWGALPFDRSAPDLTAHALRAWGAWYDLVPRDLQLRMLAAGRRATAYLMRQQTSGGSWTPLWFGNQQAPGETNPVYGTSRVVQALAGGWPAPPDEHAPGLARGIRWLMAAQHPDGGWGGAPGVTPTIEETGVALRALAGVALAGRPCDDGLADAVTRGATWLLKATAEGQDTPAAPIGLYFARLWYDEALYPLIFALDGLVTARRATGGA